MRSRLLVLGISLLAGAAVAQDAATPVALEMGKRAGQGPIREPSAFAGAAPVVVTLLPQLVATPFQPTPSAREVEVRAVRNADHAALLLEWEDASADWRTSMDGFGDMVAVAFPVAPGPAPAPFMGNVGGRVQILQWRADWQSDLERGALGMKELYPNAYAADFHHEDHLPEAAAGAFRGASGAGNPMAERERRSAVQDLMAEGFGSLTPRATQAAQGVGRHDGRRWQVVITRPLAAQGESAASLEPGAATYVAFAVWNGSQKEVGARKAWANWTPLQVAR
jgi:hypothetical protein